jgi:hypothetical protein
MSKIIPLVFLAFSQNYIQPGNNLSYQPASMQVEKGNHATRINTDSLPVKPTATTQVPSSVSFDWEVIQQMNGEDGKGTITYYFTTNGDYAGIKRDNDTDSDLSLMVYTKEGSTLMFNDKTKTITVMRMAKVVTEGGLFSKKVAEAIAKKPIKPSARDEMTITKTGKTKMICGFIADEYLVKNEGGTGSAWYARVSFDPVKIYTMGAGRPADITKLKNDPKMKNNMMAIPVINKNCLMAEMEASGMKGLETTSIKNKPVIISTAGYKIKDLKGW